MQNYYVFVQALYTLGAKCTTERELAKITEVLHVFTHEETVDSAAYSFLSTLAKQHNFENTQFWVLLERYATI